MTTLELRPPQLADAPALLAFEQDNRAFFESWVNARDPSYYSMDGVLKAIEASVREREQDLAHQFLLWQGENIVGRVNLTQIQRPHFNKAALGYRIAQAHTGRGVASAAVALALRHAFEQLSLWRVEAVVKAGNAASMRVLQRNGFREFGVAQQAILQGQQWVDLHHFECHAPTWRGQVLPSDA